jgi:hypothetical protein
VQRAMVQNFLNEEHAHLIARKLKLNNNVLAIA